MFDKFGVVGSSDRGSESIGIKSTKKSPNAEEIINNLLSKEKKVIKEEDLTDGHIETIKSWLNSKPGLEEEKIKEALKNLILILKKLPPDSKHILPICSLIIKTKKQPYFVINVLEELTRFFRPGMVDQKSEYLVEGLSLLKNIRELKPEFAEPIIKDHSEKVEKGQEASTNYYKLVNNFCFLFIGDLKEQLAKGEGKRNKRKILFSRINEKWGKDAIYIFLTTPSISKFLIKESKALDWIFDNWIDNKKQFKKFTWAERVEILCALSGNLFPEKIRNFAKEYVTKHSEAFKKELQKVL
ncbi:MAG: hypothetical protein JW855_05020, partial [Gammaproteobacteria bacterium]|nr:hypothetical protein [Gammaproteobacteria bacterium]